MAARSTPDPKPKLFAKARKVMRDIERYAAFGYVTEIEQYEADDRRLWKQVDALYDAARKEGLGDEPEFLAYRMQVRAAMSSARQSAEVSRKQFYEGRALALGGARKPVPAGMQGYLDELKLGEARRRSARKG